MTRSRRLRSIGPLSLLRNSLARPFIQGPCHLFGRRTLHGDQRRGYHRATNSCRGYWFHITTADGKRGFAESRALLNPDYSELWPVKEFTSPLFSWFCKQPTKSCMDLIRQQAQKELGNRIEMRPNHVTITLENGKSVHNR